MRWKKLGRVYAADGSSPWAVSHAYVPTAVLRDDRRIRVYVAFLDREHVGRVGYVDVDSRDPRRVLAVSPRPVLDVGEPGTFDDSGVTPTCLADDGGRLRLYYVGWQRGVRVRYSLFAGLAVSDDGGETFRRHARVPILDRSDGELHVRTAPHVLCEGGRWRLWYVGGDRWVNSGAKQVPSYTMRYLESADGLHWGPSGRVCMDLAEPDEFAFGRPVVRRDGDRHRMWYSVRSHSRGYRLGYAESADGLAWCRRDAEVGLDVSPGGWDSQMVCFASLVDVGPTTYLFYNGNNYGETGFGVAVRED